MPMNRRLSRVVEPLLVGALIGIVLFLLQDPYVIQFFAHERPEGSVPWWQQATVYLDVLLVVMAAASLIRRNHKHALLLLALAFAWNVAGNAVIVRYDGVRRFETGLVSQEWLSTYLLFLAFRMAVLAAVGILWLRAASRVQVRETTSPLPRLTYRDRLDDVVRVLLLLILASTIYSFSLSRPMIDIYAPLTIFLLAVAAAVSGFGWLTTNQRLDALDREHKSEIDLPL